MLKPIYTTLLKIQKIQMKVESSRNKILIYDSLVARTFQKEKQDALHQIINMPYILPTSPIEVGRAKGWISVCPELVLGLFQGPKSDNGL